MFRLQALGRLGSYLNMKSVNVTDEYRDAFIRALVTFKHQLVYCPLRRRQVRLHSPPPEVTDDQLRYAGEEITEDVALQLALGNYDPFTMQKLHNFDPDNPQVNIVKFSRLSIDYPLICYSLRFRSEKHRRIRGTKSLVRDTRAFGRRIIKSAGKRRTKEIVMLQSGLTQPEKY